MERKFSIGAAILVNSASRKIIIDIRGLRRLSPPSPFLPWPVSLRRHYDRIRTVPLRVYFSLARTDPIRQRFVRSPLPSYRRTTLWLMSTGWIRERFVESLSTRINAKSNSWNGKKIILRQGVLSNSVVYNENH